jgi:selenocysteine lyase/cysteine desulfurase
MFPITKERIYLNCATQGPFAGPVIEAVNKYMDKMAHKAFTTIDPIMTELAEVIGAFVNCPAERIAYAANTNQALGFVALGLDWKEGDNVVTCDQEYPANVYPWLRLKRHGVELRVAKSRNWRLDINDFRPLVDKRTRVITVSWVEFVSGLRHDLEKIAELAREHGAFFVVDAMQGMGAMPFDMAASGADAVAFGPQKWLLSIEGFGVLALSERLFAALDVAIPGAFSVKDPWNFLKYQLDYLDNGLRFYGGCPAYTSMHGLKASLEMFNSIGIEKIGAHNRMLTDKLAEGILRKGYKLVCSRGDKDWAAIVSFDPGKRDGKQIAEDLETKNIFAAARMGIMRVSPHFYNVESDIAAFLDAIPPAKI